MQKPHSLHQMPKQLSWSQNKSDHRKGRKYSNVISVIGRSLDRRIFVGTWLSTPTNERSPVNYVANDFVELIIWKTTKTITLNSGRTLASIARNHLHVPNTFDVTFHRGTMEIPAILLVQTVITSLRHPKIWLSTESHTWKCRLIAKTAMRNSATRLNWMSTTSNTVTNVRSCARNVGCASPAMITWSFICDATKGRNRTNADFAIAPSLELLISRSMRDIIPMKRNM